MAAPQYGTVCEIARRAGAILKGKGPKYTCKCVLHKDRNASAWVDAEANTYGCSVCTPGSAITAKELAERLGQDWNALRGERFTGHGCARAPDPKPSFTPPEAVAIWHLALARARNDDCVYTDRETYDYAVARGLMPAWEDGAFGVLATDMALPVSVAWWPSRGYTLVSPLFDVATGALVNVQARCVRKAEKKTLVPKGSRLAGTVFASAKARAILRGEPVVAPVVVLAEGLTDALALTGALSIPVFAASGTGNAATAVGKWARGRHVLLALDRDDAGAKVLKDTSDALYSAGATRVQRIVWPKPAKDACDVVAMRGMDALTEIVEREIKRGAA
jgi:hypothetical protein